MKKNNYHHGDLKNNLISLSIDFLQDNDIRDLKLGHISSLSGTSKTSIYRHFKNKDELIKTLMLIGFDEIHNSLLKVLTNNSLPLIDRYYLGGRVFIDYALKNSNMYRLLFGNDYNHIRNEVYDITAEDCIVFSVLKKSIEEGQKKGILIKTDSFKISVMVWSSFHGLASLLIDGFAEIEKLHEELYNESFENLLSAYLSTKVKVVSFIPFVKKFMEPNNES